MVLRLFVVIYIYRSNYMGYFLIVIRTSITIAYKHVMISDVKYVLGNKNRTII